MDDQRKSKADLIDELNHLRRQLADPEKATNGGFQIEAQDSLLTQRYRSFIEHTTDAVFCYEYDPPIPLNLPIEKQIQTLYQGVLVECNTIGAQSYGASHPEEVIGRKLTDLFKTTPGGLDDFFRTFIESEYRTQNLIGSSRTEEGVIHYYSNNGRGEIKDGKLMRVWGTFRDVTDAKKAEAALRESEERYRRLAEQAPDIIYRIRFFPDNRFEYINPAFTQVTGYTAEEFFQHPELTMALVHPEDIKYITDSAQGILPEKPTRIRWIHKDGSLILTEQHTRRIFDEEENFVGLEGIARDVTERVKAEEALAASETRLRLALESSGMGTWEWDICTNEVIWSDNVEGIFGLSPGTFDGTFEAYLDLLYPADQTYVAKVVADFVSNSQEGDRYHVEHRLEFPDGQIRWMEGQGNLFRNLDGQPLRMIGTVLDITERKEAEEALKASEASLKEAQKLAHIGNFELDLETNHLELSDEMYQIHGIKIGELTGSEKNFFETFIHPEDQEFTWEGAQNIIKTGQPASGEYRVVRPDGNVRYVYGQSKLRIDDHGKPSHLIGTIQDFTDRKLVELKVQRTADRLRVIHGIDQAVLAGKSPAEIAKTSLRSIRELLPCDFAGVVLFDYDSNGHKPLAVDVDDELQMVNVTENNLIEADSFTGLLKILREEKYYVIRDTTDEPDGILSMVIGPLEARSGILAAMISQNKLIGAINFVASEPNHFLEEHIEIATEVADSLAIAIQHARLLTDQRRYTNQLESLRKASLQLTSSLELEPILETVLEYALSLVSALDAHIFLYDGSQLSFGAARWVDNRPIQPFKEVRQDGITYTVARTGERIVIPNVDEDPLFADWKWGGAIIGLPLSRAEKVIGVMTVAFEKPHRFTGDELRILDLLADQVAIAINNANLYSSETTEKRNTAALAASARDLSAVLDQDHILHVTLDRLYEVVPYDSASLALIKNGEPYFAAERGLPEGQNIVNFREKIGGIFPLEQELMKSRLPIIISDVIEDERWKSGSTNRRVRSWLGVPLITGVQTIGFLMLDKYEPGFYTESSAALAGAFAAHAAIALQNAQLFENERRKTLQLEGLHQLSIGISAQLDIETLLETTAKYAIELLGGISGGLYLYRPERAVLEWSVAFGESMVPLGKTLKKGEGLSGKVWEQDKPLFVGDYRNWEGRAEHFDGYLWTSVIGAPISRGGSFYGVLNVLTDEVDAFSDSDQKVLDLFTTQAAIALENAQLFDSVTLQNDQLRELAAQLAALEELERKRLAQELHDRVGQNLTALSINLNMVKSFLPAEVADTLGSRLDDSQVLVGETAQHIRDVMADLRPPVLDDYGLLAALRWYGDRFTNRTGVIVTIQGDDRISRLNLTLETTLFRIAQEALTNISRHAEAKNVLIKLTGQPGKTQFVISDDGIGFTAADLSYDQDKPGWGLQIMRERIEAIGGDFRIETPAKGGTVIRVTLHEGA